ncbi:MAG: hypothetical protein KGN34_10720 [Sphingomonadales bacterium]|nr:hypothetical protein [Sphingomonadales bacterium]
MQQPADRMRPQRSLTSHRLFPPLVALWFGALFGLSTLAVRTSLFEQMVLASGFDRLVPAAAPPLGHVARLLIALAFGLVGAGIGRFVARLVAGARGGVVRAEPDHAPAENPYDSYKVRARDAHPDAPARRPISVHDELGAPLMAAEPATGWRFGEDADPAEAPVAEDPPLPEWLREPAPVTAEARETLAVVVPESAPEPVMAPEPEAEAVPAIAPEPIPAAAATPAVADPAYPDAWRNTAERIAQAHPSALSHVELIERLAMALGERDGKVAASAALGPAEPAPALPGGNPDATIAALREALATLRQG